MNPIDFIWFLIIGVLAGWIGGLLMKGRGFGCFGNLAVGIIGAVLGGWMFRVLGLRTVGLRGALLTAVAGAVVLLWIVGAIKRR
ncbi:MAG: GlsB/YeaQ/YmgE family stress response membrane protein [Tepidisphaerales bacterium]